MLPSFSLGLLITSRLGWGQGEGMWWPQSLSGNKAMRGRVPGTDLKGMCPQEGNGYSAVPCILGQPGPLCDLQTKLGPWPGAVGSQAGQWEEGESVEIKLWAQGSVPGILEARLLIPQPRGGFSINMGWVSCTHRARARFFIALLWLR